MQIENISINKSSSVQSSEVLKLQNRSCSASFKAQWDKPDSFDSANKEIPSGNKWFIGATALATIAVGSFCVLRGKCAHRASSGIDVPTSLMPKPFVESNTGGFLPKMCNLVVDTTNEVAVEGAYRDAEATIASIRTQIDELNVLNKKAKQKGFKPFELEDGSTVVVEVLNPGIRNRQGRLVGRSHRIVKTSSDGTVLSGRFHSDELFLINDECVISRRSMDNAVVLQSSKRDSSEYTYAWQEETGKILRASDSQCLIYQNGKLVLATDEYTTRFNSEAVA